MEKKKIIYLCLFAVLILIFTSCHPRHVSDIKPTMTKEEVVSLWGPTNLITQKTTNERTFEIWEYHFASSGSICSVTFFQDRVTTTECHPSERGYYSQLAIPYPGPYYYPYPYFFPYPYYYGGYYRYHRPYHHAHPYHPHRR
jgi:hypothetical protein